MEMCNVVAGEQWVRFFSWGPAADSVLYLP